MIAIYLKYGSLFKICFFEGLVILGCNLDFVNDTL